MMVVETALGRVGIVHASGFANDMRSWDVVWEDAQRLSASETVDETLVDWSLEGTLVWRDAEQFAERRDDTRLRETLAAIDLVITGHSLGAQERALHRHRRPLRRVGAPHRRRTRTRAPAAPIRAERGEEVEGMNGRAQPGADGDGAVRRPRLESALSSLRQSRSERPKRSWSLFYPSVRLTYGAQFGEFPRRILQGGGPHRPVTFVSPQHRLGTRLPPGTSRTRFRRTESRPRLTPPDRSAASRAGCPRSRRRGRRSPDRCSRWRSPRDRPNRR